MVYLAVASKKYKRKRTGNKGTCPTEDTVYYTHEYNIDLSSRQVYLMGEEDKAWDESEPGVEFAMANRFIRNFTLLMRASKDPILIHMKTCGGDWSEGMAIYDTIKSCPNYVTILNYSHASSMSSIILCAADYRVMMPHSIYMIHQGSVYFGGTHKQFMTYSAQNNVTLDQMLDVYVERLSKSGNMKDWPVRKIRDWLTTQMDRKEEVYFSAEEAVERGFADAVFGSDAACTWDALLT